MSLYAQKDTIQFDHDVDWQIHDWNGKLVISGKSQVIELKKLSPGGYHLTYEGIVRDIYIENKAGSK